MATYDRRRLEITRIEFHVPAPAPWGAAWTEVMKAIHAAVAELHESGELPEAAEPADNVIAIAPGDDEVIVSYEIHVSSEA